MPGERRIRSIREAVRRSAQHRMLQGEARSSRQPRDRSPIQTVIAVERAVYEFVRLTADRERISLKAALSKILRPIMEVKK
jgi:hypothetical protein